MEIGGFVKVKILDKELYKDGFKRVHPGDVGFDLRAREDVVLASGDRAVVPTGIAVDTSEARLGDLCVFGLIKDRSGMAAKRGLHVLAGVIDPNYRGEIKAVLYNTNELGRVEIKRGERIAQLIFLVAWCGEPETTEELSESERGEKGFGSTGTF